MSTLPNTPDLRLPPSDLMAEQALLGSLLLNRQPYPGAFAIIPRDRGEWFYRPDHRELWDVLVRLYDSGEAVDIVTVRNALANAGKLESVGGVNYLVELAESVTTHLHAESHARIVRDAGLRRDLIRSCGRIADLAHAPCEDLGRLLDEARVTLQRAASHRPAGMGETAAELLNSLAKRISEHAPIIETLPTGWALLDSTIGGLIRAEYTALIGVPGTGKTTLLDTAVVGGLRCNPDAKATIFSLETSPAVRLARLVAGDSVEVNESGGIVHCIPIGALLRGELQDAGQQHALEAIERFGAGVKGRLRYISDVSDAGEIGSIIEQDKPDIVGIDHAGLLTIADGTDSEVSRFDAALSRIVTALRSANAAAIIIGEVGKASLKNESLDMSSFRGSARFASLAATFIAMMRRPPQPPDRDPQVIARIVKSRFGRSDVEQVARFFGGLSYFSWGEVSDVITEVATDGE